MTRRGVTVLPGEEEEEEGEEGRENSIEFESDNNCNCKNGLSGPRQQHG